MRPLLLFAFLGSSTTASAQVHPLQELIDAARTNSPKLRDLIEKGMPLLHGRDGAAVWGQDFLFAVEAEKPASLSIDHQPQIVLNPIAGSKYWYKLLTLRLGTTHTYTYFSDGKTIGTYDVAGYNPDAYPMAGAPRGALSPMKSLTSKIYCASTARFTRGSLSQNCP